jgi:hypothetical protein
MVALLAALAWVLRLLAGRLVLVALLATLVLIGTRHDETPLVIINVMATVPDAITFRIRGEFLFSL